MREKAILRLQDGQELGVEIDRDDLDRDEIVVRRLGHGKTDGADLLAVIDEHLAHAETHPDGTTDQLLEPDRLRPY